MSTENKVLFFEPVDVITTKEEFTKELILYRERENLDLFILKEGMEPLVEIDGVKYRGMLETPTAVRANNSILRGFTFVTGFNFGYKIPVLYPVEE